MRRTKIKEFKSKAKIFSNLEGLCISGYIYVKPNKLLTFKHCEGDNQKLRIFRNFFMFEKTIYINLTRKKHSHFYHWMTEEFLPFIYFASKKPNARYVVYRKQNEKKVRHHRIDTKKDDIFWNAFDAIYKRLPYEVLFTTDLNPEAKYYRLEKWADPRLHWKKAKEKMLLTFEVVRNIVPAPKRKYDIMFQYRNPKGRRGMKNMEECKNLTDEILDATTYMWKPSNDPEDFWKDVP